LMKPRAMASFGWSFAPHAMAVRCVLGDGVAMAHDVAFVAAVDDLAIRVLNRLPWRWRRVAV
jgi:hypothetical protein